MFVVVQVANYCRERIPSALAEEIEFVKECQSNESITESCQELWEKAFTNCFVKVDTEVGGLASQEPVASETVGSTAVVALICSSHIIVANCGDSRAVLCRGKEPMALSVDHKVRDCELHFYIFLLFFINCWELIPFCFILFIFLSQIEKMNMKGLKQLEAGLFNGMGIEFWEIGRAHV